MGLFGEMDASDIPENPFYVAPGTYECVLSEANLVDKKDGSGQGLAFKWVIEDEDSEYNGSSVQDWKNVYPDITSDEVTPNIRKDMSRLRQRLTEMGLSLDDMDNLLIGDNLGELVGMKAYVTVTETSDRNDPDKKYTNVKSVKVEV